MNAKHDRITHFTDLRQPPTWQDQAAPFGAISSIIRVLPGQTGRAKRTANSDSGDPLPGHLHPLTSPGPVSRAPASGCNGRSNEPPFRDGQQFPSQSANQHPEKPDRPGRRRGQIQVIRTNCGHLVRCQRSRYVTGVVRRPGSSLQVRVVGLISAPLPAARRGGSDSVLMYLRAAHDRAGPDDLRSFPAERRWVSLPEPDMHGCVMPPVEDELVMRAVRAGPHNDQVREVAVSVVPAHSG